MFNESETSIINDHNESVSIFFTDIQLSDYKLISFSYWLRFKSALTLLNEKVKVVNSFVKNDMDLNGFLYKVVRYRTFFTLQVFQELLAHYCSCRG